ncbi:MAG: hypothetical protein IIC24_09820 [Chloroflexi bacterium]|nr:hypothetical protein [Chloroflexota bacterium]MCH8308978.1 hypothetical protein [Chloroflexota bacterium]
MKIVALASGSLFLVGGLIVAVFLSLQLINQSAQAASSGGPGVGLVSVAPSGGSSPQADSTGSRECSIEGPSKHVIMERTIDDGSGPVTQSTDLIITTAPSALLPQSNPMACGIFLGVNGNDMTLGVGSVEVEVQLEVTVDLVNGRDSDRSVSVNHTGPEANVVITADTTIYRDDTERVDYDPDGDLPPSGTITLQQELTEVDSLDGLSGNYEVQVWGAEGANGVVADILVYREIG